MPCLPSSWSGWQSCGVGAGCNTSDDDDERWHIPRMMARCNCSDERWLALDDELVHVTRLLRPMSLEAGPLMDLVRQARGRGSCTLPPGAGVVGRGTSGGGGRQQQQQAVVLEEEAVMRVLARRPERMGSKLLKEEYKMSKRLKA